MYGIITTNQAKACGERAPTFKFLFINFLVSGWKKRQTNRVQVLHDVLEGRVRPELLKELPLVEQRVH